MTVEAQVALCAQGEAAWHAAAYAGLGSTWQTDGAVAWGEQVPHRYLLAALTLSPRPALPTQLVTTAPGVVRDSFAALSPTALPGWQPRPHDPWMLRAAGRIDGPVVAGVVVQPTDDPLLFERVAFLAAGGAPPARPGELHPRGAPGMHFLLAWRGHEAVGTALVVQHDRGTSVSGVAVVARERRRGIGAALTAAAVGAVDGPVSLTASAAGIGVYRRLGFRELPRPVHWHPPQR